MKKALVSTFLLAFLIAGCDPGKPDTDSDFEQALAYSQCMRSNGVPDFPDPRRNGNGVQVDVPKGQDTTKAEEACRDKMPQGDTEGRGAATIDEAKLADWTACMRGKLPEFPDPQVGGNTLTLTLKGTGIRGDSADFENARKACEKQFPGGSLRVVDGQ